MQYRTHWNPKIQLKQNYWGFSCSNSKSVCGENNYLTTNETLAEWTSKAGEFFLI